MRVWLSLSLLTLVAAPAAAQGPPDWPYVMTARFVDLSYPASALEAGQTGVVLVQVTTDATGRVIASKSLAGPASLAAPAVENVKQWTLTPGARTEVVVYHFEKVFGLCNDDSRSLFRLVHPNFAVITACRGTGRTRFTSERRERGFEHVGFGSVPQYPARAQSARITGVVVLDLRADRRGRIVESKALTTLPLLTDVAVAHSRTGHAYAGRAGRRIFMVYEFALDSLACEEESGTVVRAVLPEGYVRLIGCPPSLSP
jgi:hypothetical protein